MSPTAARPGAPRVAKVTEAQWQRTVLDGLRVFGWVAFHDRVAWRSDPGYPDLTAIHVAQRRVIFCELKTDTGKLSPAQRCWLETLRAAGQEAYVWRPSDWDQIVKVLTARPTDDETASPAIPGLR